MSTPALTIVLLACLYLVFCRLTPRVRSRPEGTGYLRHDENADYTLNYPGPGTVEHNKPAQFADGPWKVVYRFTNGGGQRWEIDAGESSRQVPADDSDLPGPNPGASAEA